MRANDREAARAVTIAVPFPEARPPGYEWLPDEVPFDPERHLELEPPSRLTTLEELGYDADDIAPTSTPVAFSSPFRILSDEGAEVMLLVARRLRRHARRAADRIENTVRGGCYRSRWLRDLCLSPDVTTMMSDLFGTGVAPHPMPVHLGHLNYEPTDIDQAVDKWHHDTVPLDFVMFVTDPTSLPGGQFEYFMGTKAEMAALASAGEPIPQERVVAADVPGPGHAIALHGDMVVHRGAPLTAAAERITMVNAYVPLDRTRSSQSRTRDLIGVDDPVTLYTEWARHAAWCAEGRLARLVETMEFGQSPETAAAELEAAIADVQRTIADMRAGQTQAAHYEH